MIWDEWLVTCQNTHCENETMPYDKPSGAIKAWRRRYDVNGRRMDA